MTDYTEHLISMAGGDGDPDLLASIENHNGLVREWLDTDMDDRRNVAGLFRSVSAQRGDIPALLTLVREQRARLAVVAELANWSAKHGWKLDAAAIRAALEVKP